MVGPLPGHSQKCILNPLTGAKWLSGEVILARYASWSRQRKLGPPEAKNETPLRGRVAPA
jgi:hypothetical protein